MKKTMFMLLLSGLLLSCQESLEDKCAREAKEYTEKKCPAPIGENIVIDSIIITPSKEQLTVTPTSILLRLTTCCYHK